MNSSSEFLNQILDVIENKIAPITSEYVKEGNMYFGGAIVKKDDLSLVCADSNKMTEWLLLHGEVSCLRTYNALPAEGKPEAADCIMVSTHEPCALCLAAITWSGFNKMYFLFRSGFNKMYFLFSYEDYKPVFDCTKILKEVFGSETGGYRRENSYWSSYHIAELVEALPEGEEKKALQSRVSALRVRYDGINKVFEDSAKAKGITFPRTAGED
ncbi:hypothetical protein CEUSTIGMA_g8073.t1 [Chlamydomonas eustigma]|uniref:CMP/dCMP-type deaminase domain-containing protein n=1 Tax=Chlamydomonas eustigma TaxID=1157962 RepID=A0A250XC37_9CHLO|nr:hypothetical protein CEUSTIGMA_g8073.t1 [Chlamydomonas eustigma]|eukprot:GAX80638.1 hypothetical protein CEUSTIGMA_g8073.t1 [Chlamydomonas eustigma]